MGRPTLTAQLSTFVVWEFPRISLLVSLPLSWGPQIWTFEEETSPIPDLNVPPHLTLSWLKIHTRLRTPTPYNITIGCSKRATTTILLSFFTDSAGCLTSQPLARQLAKFKSGEGRESLEIVVWMLCGPANASADFAGSAHFPQACQQMFLQCSSKLSSLRTLCTSAEFCLCLSTYSQCVRRHFDQTACSLEMSMFARLRPSMRIVSFNLGRASSLSPSISLFCRKNQSPIQLVHVCSFLPLPDSARVSAHLRPLVPSLFIYLREREREREGSSSLRPLEVRNLLGYSRIPLIWTKGEP